MYTSSNPVYGLSVHSDKAYISVWGSTSVLSVDIKEDHHEIKVLEEKLGKEVLFGVDVVKNSISRGKKQIYINQS